MTIAQRTCARVLAAAAAVAAAFPLLAAQPPASPAPTAAASSIAAKADERCTTEPRSDWLTEAEMRLLAQHRGYRIHTFKVAYGSCYEIYGFNKSGQIVEAYFNPVTARLIRQNIAR